MRSYVPAKGTTINTTKTNTINKNNSTKADSKSTFEQCMKEIQSRLNKKPSGPNK